MNRDKAIDLLKFLAVVFVVNSHMDICYPDAYKSLATGGSLGDALFFFCSGYTLFLGKNLEFLCWYKRRLARILPSVIVCVLGYSCIYGEGWYTAVGGYWFVRCIFLYYVVIYFVRRYLSERMWLAFTCVGVIVCAWWLLFENPRHSIYGGGYFMWGHYFIQMMLGAVVGKCRDSIRSMPWFDIPCLIGLITMYFGLWKFAMRTIGFEWIQLVTIPLLSLIIYFFYKIAKSSFSSRLTKGGGICCHGSRRVVLGSVFVASRFPFGLIEPYVPVEHSRIDGGGGSVGVYCEVYFPVYGTNSSC